MEIILNAILILLFFLPAGHPGKDDGLEVVASIQLNANLYLTGSAVLIADSSLVVTANGGLFGIHPTGWVKPVDSVNAVVSYIYRPQHRSSIYTVYNFDLRRSEVMWVRSDDYTAGADTVASIDSCICYLEGNQHAVLLHGRRNDRYLMWELRSDGLVEVFNLALPPRQVQMTGASTVLAAFGHKIISINRNSAPSVYFEGDERQVIYGFLQAPSHRFYLSLEEGIMELAGGELVLRVPGIKGKMLWQEGKIIVLDQEESSVAILVER